MIDLARQGGGSRGAFTWGVLFDIVMAAIVSTLLALIAVIVFSSLFGSF